MYMQLVINIDENLYTRLFDNGDVDAVDMLRACVAICKGKVLPKGHGDLIDRSKICKAILAEEDNCIGAEMTNDELDAYNDGVNSMYDVVQRVKSIIEADRESEEE